MSERSRGDRRITLQELEGARQTVRLCAGLSRKELARTICEHWGWVAATGSHKVTACLNVLEQWEQQGLLQLPAKRTSMARWSSEQDGSTVPTDRTNPGAPLAGELPFSLEIQLGCRIGLIGTAALGFSRSRSIALCGCGLPSI
jgi:hypothetical protein